MIFARTSIYSLYTPYYFYGCGLRWGRLRWGRPPINPMQDHHGPLLPDSVYFGLIGSLPLLSLGSLGSIRCWQLKEGSEI